MGNKKLHIVMAHDVITILSVYLVDVKTGKQQLLQPGRNYTVEYVEKRTQRCKVCDQTYPESEIVRRNGEQLCKECDRDKYLILPEDIPF